MPINISEPFLGHRSVFFLWILHGGMPRFVPTEISILSTVFLTIRAGAGVIVGPTVGTALWRIKYRSITKAIDAKDSEFFNRVAKHRVDASLQSPTQPVPDYYGMLCFAEPKALLMSYVCCLGERIGSLHQYRQVCSAPLLFRKQLIILLTVAARSSKVQTQSLATGKSLVKVSPEGF